MTFATSAGCDNIATWLEGSTVAFALICFAMLLSCSGSIIRSLLDTTYRAGFATPGGRGRLGVEDGAGGLRLGADEASFFTGGQILREVLFDASL
ncbi:MAG TPA: hypothetical protein VGL62_13070 [Vicinamibacterales bacterium]|jgi:hypothetical protein